MRPLRQHRPGERQHPVDEDVEPDAEDDADALRLRPKVRSPDAEGRGSAAGAREAAEGRAARTVVARRRDDERVQLQRAVDGARVGRVGERRIRGADADERDPHRAVRVAILVRVDCALEARDQLVGAGIDGVAAADVALPAGDADRQHRCARRRTGEPVRAVGPDEQAGHLRPMPLEAGRVVRLRRRAGVGVVVPEHVDPVGDAAAQVRLRAVDAGVEQADRDAAAVEPRQRDVGLLGRPARELVLGEQRGGDCGRIGDADRVDARHLGLAFEQRDRLGI